MKTIFLFLYFFLLVGCSGIGFYEAGDQPLSSSQDSLACEEGASSDNPDLCSKRGKMNNGFFRKGREESRPGYLTEYFEIPNERDELEIVFILDVSNSMDDNLKKVGQNMMALLSHIQHKKWRMIFTTADHGDHDQSPPTTQQKWENYRGSRPKFGKLMPLEKRGKVLHQVILQHDTPDYAQIFKDTLTRENPNNCSKAPYCQGFNEQPLRSLQSTILRYKTDEPQQLFFKPQTDTVVIIITDEDERREDSKNATSARDVIATFMQVFKGQRKRLFGFSISIQNETCLRKENGDYGRRVGRLADLTVGKTLFASHQAKSGNISICSEDYGQALADISQITRTVTESLTLEKMFYIPETVDVQLSPSQPNVSWRFYGRKLVFSKDILPNTKVRVSYRYEQNSSKRK